MSATRSNPRKLSPSRNNHVLRDSPKTADFDPRNIKTPLAVWCRSDLGAELNGATVSKWLDMSGNGRDFSQSTAGEQPPFRQVGQGQRPEVFFDDDRMTGSDLYAMLADKGEWSIFVALGAGWDDDPVVNGDNFSNSRNVVTANPSVGYVGICSLGTSYGGFGGGIYNSGYKNTIPVTAGKISTGEAAVFVLYSHSGGIESRQNGVDGTTGAAADLVSTATTLMIGDIADNGLSTEFYDGPISELLIFDGTLDSSEISQVEQYLADRYDIRIAAPAAAPETSLISIDNDSKLLYPTVMAYASGPPAGLTRSSGGSDWSCGAASVATITDGGAAYVQCDVTSNQSTPVARHWMIGLGYASSITGTGQTSSNAYAWAEYAVYCWGGVAAAAFASGTLVHGSYPSGGPSGGFAVNRSWRVAVDSDVVTIKYSDDSWSSSTTWYTFSTGLDIATNGPLRASFSINTAGTVIENVKMFGVIS